MSEHFFYTHDEILLHPTETCFRFMSAIAKMLSKYIECFGVSFAN